jgi:hypothetical protein
LKLEYFNSSLSKIKELKLLSFVAKKNIKGQKVYFETGLEMKNMETGSRTELVFSNLQFEKNTNINPGIFSTQYLNRKWW